MAELIDFTKYRQHLEELKRDAEMEKNSAKKIMSGAIIEWLGLTLEEYEKKYEIANKAIERLNKIRPEFGDYMSDSDKWPEKERKIIFDCWHTLARWDYMREAYHILISDGENWMESRNIEGNDLKPMLEWLIKAAENEKAEKTD